MKIHFVKNRSISNFYMQKTLILLYQSRIDFCMEHYIFWGRMCDYEIFRVKRFMICWYLNTADARQAKMDLALS